MTITHGMRDLWQSSFCSTSPAVTSSMFAYETGLISSPTDTASPFMMSMYLAVSMSSTYGAIYHMGFRNGRQLHSIFVEETAHQFIIIKSIRNSSDGKRSIITTTRRLVRSSDDTVLFEIDKLELHRNQPAGVGDYIANIEKGLRRDVYSLPSQLLEKADKAVARRKSRVGWESGQCIEEGKLLLHTLARPVGVTANLQLSTIFQVSHPIHFDRYQRRRSSRRSGEFAHDRLPLAGPHWRSLDRADLR